MPTPATFQQKLAFVAAMVVQVAVCTCPKFMPSLMTLLRFHTLALEESVGADQTLISYRGTFALGFFSPENSKNFFLGIWYNTIPKNLKVWVANRGSPLDSPGVLTLSADGNLVV
ncbi:hypothetical protein ACFX11_024314 [Malus domestica]